MILLIRWPTVFYPGLFTKFPGTAPGLRRVFVVTKRGFCHCVWVLIVPVKDVIPVFIPESPERCHILGQSLTTGDSGHRFPSCHSGAGMTVL